MFDGRFLIYLNGGVFVLGIDQEIFIFKIYGLSYSEIIEFYLEA